MIGVYMYGNIRNEQLIIIFLDIIYGDKYLIAFINTERIRTKSYGNTRKVMIMSIWNKRKSADEKWWNDKCYTTEK